MSRSGFVLVTTSFPLREDGSEAAGSFVSDLADELALYGAVRVVAPGPVDTCEARGDNIRIFRFAAPARPLSTLKPWRPVDLLRMFRVNHAGLAATRRAVADGPVTRLLALWALPSGAWARRAADEAGLSYSVWTLGSDIWVLGRVPGIRAWLRSVLRSAACCYSDGLLLAEDTRRIAGRDVEFLPSTRRLEATRVAPPRRCAPFRLLFLGRWHPNKGVDLLLDALDRLDDDDWARIECVDICGGGPMEALVRARAGALASAQRPVAIHGYLDKAAAAAAMAAADWLLIPSRIESIPVVFSDAMKLGLPVISTPVGDLSALVAESPACGHLAAAVDAESFARAIAVALSDDTVRFAAGVVDRARRFDLATVARRIAGVANEPRHG